MIDERFLSRKDGIGCSMCPDTGTDDVVWHSPIGKVHLKNDADYRGYCVLVYHRHAIELYDLTLDERYQWIGAIAHISEQIAAVCQPAKMNTAIFGNMVPHLHCHLIPRYFDDPDWNRAPVFRSDSERRPLSPEDYATLMTELRAKF